jgi:hypothetical protein
MNTELRKMIVEAEGRYLHEAEQARIREWTSRLPSRLAVAARLSAAESEIVRDATARFLEANSEYANKVRDARAKTERDMRLTLRYCAAAHVRDDEAWFRRAYAAWIAELLSAIVEPELLAAGQDVLGEAVSAHLDPADARAIRRYVAIFAEELRRR